MHIKGSLRAAGTTDAFNGQGGTKRHLAQSRDETASGGLRCQALADLLDDPIHGCVVSFLHLTD
jgi:hypothetical protein